MKISKEFPPNYEQIKLTFPNLEEHKPFFAYGDVIYNPFDQELRKDFEIHEEVHIKQQGGNPHNWWYQYLTDKQFRLDQEIEAYGTQYKYVKSISPTEISEWLLEQFAHALSGELYGNLLTYHQAHAKLRHYAKTI